MVIQLASSSTDELRSRIATDCRDRWNQQVVEVEKKNAQFIAALEAQGVRITPRKPNCLRRCFQRIRRLACAYSDFHALLICSTD